MAHKMQFNEETGIIESVLTGKILAEELFQIMLECTDLAYDFDCYMWLNDYTNADFDFSSFDIYNIPQHIVQAAEKLGVNRFHIKRAAVVKQIVDDHHFAEALASSRAQAFKAFLTIEEARAWLKQQSRGQVRHYENVDIPNIFPKN
jgi:hypothetical protein